VSCRSNAAFLEKQIGTLSDDKIAAMCSGSADCVSARQQERALYQQAYGQALAHQDANVAARDYLGRLISLKHKKSGQTVGTLPVAMVPILLFYIELKYRGGAVIHDLNRRLFGSNDHWIPRQREHNHVRPGELQLEAHETQSDFLIRLYEFNSRHEDRGRLQTRKTQLYALCALVFLLLNYWITGAGVCHSATCWAVDHFGSNLPVWLGFALFAMLVFGPLHTDDWERRWIFHPPLYRKLEQKDEEWRKKEREWKAEAVRRATVEHSNANNPTSKR